MSEASLRVLAVLRQPDHLQWYLVPMLAIVVYVYVAEAKAGNFSAVWLGIGAWAVELIWEMFNAGILTLSHYAPLWSTPGASAFVIYAGLNIEIAFFFALSGLVIVKSLPESPKRQIFRLPNRIVIPVGWAALAVTIEVLLNRAGLLVWDYAWWGWPHVWLILGVYGGGWLALAWCHDHLSLVAKKRGALLLLALASVCHVVFASFLGWI